MFTEDADDFLDVDEFAITANYDGGTTVTGIFSQEYVEVSGVESKRPVFLCEAADVSDVAHGKSLIVSGTTYSVVGVQPDETNFMTRLVLSK